MQGSADTHMGDERQPPPWLPPNSKSNRTVHERWPCYDRRTKLWGVDEAERPRRQRRSMLSTHLVGRDAELGLLREALIATTDGRGCAAVIVGEAGIGKSRLARAAADEAQQRGMAVLWGRATQRTTPVAYRPLAEALYSAVRAGGAFDGAELAPFRPILGRLIPEWRVDDHDHTDDVVVALAEGVLRFLREAARGTGCLLVLEDLQWADPETLTVVEYLVDNLDAEPVVCLITVRAEDASTALDLTRRLRAQRATELLELTRLTAPDVAEMVCSCLDASAVSGDVTALVGRAEGVPFLVEELLADAVTSGALVQAAGSWTASQSPDAVVPLTFVDSMRRRLATLGTDARAVVRAAAVLGRNFDWELVAEITGVGAEAIIGALHEARNTQIVSVDVETDAFRFRHALTRDAVLADLLPPERAALAYRALDVIEAARPGLPGTWCDLAAELAVAAGDRKRAAALLLEAGRRALSSGALASAEATLDRARAVALADDPTLVDIEECLTEVLSMAGNCDRAVEVGESVLTRLGDDRQGAPRRAEVRLRLARAAVAATRWSEADGHLDRARVEAATADDEKLTARIDAVNAQTTITRWPEKAESSARAALETAERVDLPEVACEALEIIGRCERQRELDAAEAAFAGAYAIANAHDLTVWRVRALHELGTVDLLRDGEVARLEEARELAATQGALATAAVLDVQIAACLAMRDDPEPALLAARRATELARRYRLNLTLAASLAFEANVHARALRRERMEQCLAEALNYASGEPDIEVLAAFAATILAFVEEDRAAARRHLRRAAEIGSASIGDQSTGPPHGYWVLVEALEGDNPPDSSTLGHEPVHHMSRALLRYARAVVAGRRGEADAAVALVAEGDRFMRHLTWHRSYGHRLLSEAALADGWGDPVGWLRAALAFFDAHGDERIASACRSLLRKAGAPVPRRRGAEPLPGPLAALGVTSREVEVLRLLAHGSSNQEIAVRLYLSPRTVERHIANLTVKVGVERRAQLVAFAARVMHAT
jgi:DNA-binding CsgD family transcriptional regulator/tetratricopeptide (TPR) repeat protein